MRRYPEAKESMDRFSELTQTVKQYEAALIRYAARMLNDRDAARDAVQEAFIRFVKSASGEGSRKKIANERAWLYKVTRNICLDTLRSRKKRLELPLDECVGIFACEKRTPDVRLKIDEETRMIRKIIDGLEPREREILVLKLEHGRSYKEIAGIMELSVGNVGFILHNTMKKLRSEYGKRSGGELK